MRTARIVAGLAAAAAAVPLALVVGAGSASAAPNGCSSGALCVYWDTAYRGSKYEFFGSNTSWGAYAIEDDDSSWFNNGSSGLEVGVYPNRSYGGGADICLARGDGNQIALSYNDKGSSNLWQSSC